MLILQAWDGVVNTTNYIIVANQVDKLQSLDQVACAFA